MVLMALDHVRDYVTNLRIRPEDLSRASVALFTTRWVTHFCAPAFFLLAGVGIGIAMGRGRSPTLMSRILLTRGLWLVFLDLTVSAIGWQFGFDLVPAFALVIWALGWSMVVMAALVHAPRGGDRHRVAGHPCVAQPSRWSTAGRAWRIRASLAFRSRPRFRDPGNAVHRVSAGPVVRRHGARVRARADLRMDARTPPPRPGLDRRRWRRLRSSRFAW